MAQGQQIEKMLPQWLQLFKDPMNPQGLQQYQQNYYAQNVAPQLAQQESNLYNNGQAYGSFGGGMLGQEAAQGNFDTYQAGLAYAQQLFGDQVAGRQSYFSGGPAVAQQQNQLDVNRGLGVAGLQTQNAGQQNNYNLGTNQTLNGFNQQNYQNQFQAAQYNNQANAQRLGGVFGGLGMLGNIFAPGLGSLASGIGSGIFGGGSGGASSLGPVAGTFGSGAGNIGSLPIA